MFLSVEGIEASGKSTLLASLASRLRGGGYPVVETLEPGGTALGQLLRAAFLEPGLRIVPLAEAFIVNAARAQLVSEVVRPALEAKAWLLSDRFALSTLAYQGYGRGLDLAFLNGLAAAATHGVRPDLVFIVDVPLEVSRERVAARNAQRGIAGDRLEREDAAFHQRVRDGYLELAREDERTMLLDGTLAPEALLERAWSLLERAAAT